MAKSISEKNIIEYKKLLEMKGEDGFYRHAVAFGIKESIQTPNPENEMLEMSEAFFLLNRRTGEDLYNTFGKIFRRAAHTLFRQLKKEETAKPSKKFLRVV